MNDLVEDHETTDPSNIRVLDKLILYHGGDRKDMLKWELGSTDVCSIMHLTDFNRIMISGRLWCVSNDQKAFHCNVDRKK